MSLPSTTRFRSGLAATGLVILAACGAATTFTNTWRAPDAQPVSMRGKKVLAVYMSKDEGSRRAAEDALAGEITRRGGQGVSAYSLVGATEISDTAAAKARLKLEGFAGIVSMRMLGSKEQLNYSPGYYTAMPYYGSPYGYWGYGWGATYSPGYVYSDTKVTVETLVFSLEQDKLLWAGTSETTNPERTADFIREVANAAAGEMQKSGLIGGS